MEKVLVAIDNRSGAWGALAHACSLAKRMRVELNVLLIYPRVAGSATGQSDANGESVRKRLELQLARAQAEGITINYFMTEGPYVEEVIHFVNHHKIALLVHETGGKDARSAARKAVALRALRHRLTCTMEVVAPIKTTAE